MPGSRSRQFDFRRIETSDLFRIETGEGAAEIIALAQDGDPGQAGLKAVENEFFEQGAGGEFGNTPFVVVIGDVNLIRPRPGAAPLAIGMVNSLDLSPDLS